LGAGFFGYDYVLVVGEVMSTEGESTAYSETHGEEEGSERRVGLDERKESWHLGKEAEKGSDGELWGGSMYFAGFACVCVCVFLCAVALREEEEEGRGESALERSP